MLRNLKAEPTACTCSPRVAAACCARKHEHALGEANHASLAPAAPCPRTLHSVKMLRCAPPALFPPRRYEHALNKANYASLALRPESRGDEDDGAGLDEDEDLYQSLNK